MSSYYGNCYGYGCGSSNWYRWGRWILAGILIFVAICVLLFVLCINRRRRRSGRGNFHPSFGVGNRRRQQQQQAPPPQSEMPFGGGGGAGGGGIYNQNPGGYQQQYAPPPGPPPVYGGSNADYYGQTPEVSQPQNAYQPAQVK